MLRRFCASRTVASAARSGTAVPFRFHHTEACKPKILITGSMGQIGTDLCGALRQKYGAENVIATDIRKSEGHSLHGTGPYYYCDALDSAGLTKLVVNNNITWIVHLSAIMSVLGESMPQKTLDLNVDAVRNVLEISRLHKLRCYIPSTMAVFNKDAGQDMTKDDTILNPTTVYGITKVFLEHIGCYYHKKYGVDFRCMRYPGMIAADSLPGGGTTDYAVHMYHAALKKEKYACPVLPNEYLPMMYMPDCIKSTITLLEAPEEQLKRRVYNIAALSFTPEDVKASIRKQIPDFDITYERGLAQDIAETWPNQMDDANARNDWNWKPDWTLDMMTEDMLKKIPTLHKI